MCVFCDIKTPVARLCVYFYPPAPIRQYMVGRGDLDKPLLYTTYLVGQASVLLNERMDDKYG